MSFKVANNEFLVECRGLDKTTGESYDLSNSVEDVLFRKRFLEDYFPLVSINFRTTIEMRDTIRDNDINIYLRISMYENDGTQSTEELDTSSFVETEKIFDGIIRIYEKPFETSVSKIEEENKDENETQKQAAPFVNYKISGIPEDLISKNETNMNAVFKNAELIDAAVYLISQVDKSSKMYIQETTNKTIEEDILVPPISLIPALEFIDETYHYFYSHKANFFYDSNAFYMYDPIESTLNPTNIIECNILSQEATSNSEITSLPKIDNETGNIKLSYKTLPAFVRNNKIAEHHLGSKTIYYYYDNNFNLETAEEQNPEAFTKVRYLWEKMDNIKSNEYYNFSKAISVVLSNINPELISPLSILRVNSSEYPTANGDYGISEVIYGFVSSDLRHYKTTIQISTYKKSK